MPETPDLPAALREGEQALAAFTAAQPPSEAQALAVLLARDAIRAALAAEPAPDADSLLALQAFDRQVCAQQAALLRAIAQLETWRNLLQPPAEAWWWQPPRSRWTRYDVAANAATGVFLTASLSLLAETSSRFLAADSGLSGSSAIVVQTVLTLAAGGGALTKAGRTVVEQTYNSLRVPKLLRQEASAGLALLVLLALMSIHALLPRFAELFNQRGYANFQAQQFESAIANYQTAIALKPDYARAHYRLALVYEELQQCNNSTPPATPTNSRSRPTRPPSMQRRN